jgi:hypothetical protein
MMTTPTKTSVIDYFPKISNDEHIRIQNAQMEVDIMDLRNVQVRQKIRFVGKRRNVSAAHKSDVYEDITDEDGAVDDLDHNCAIVIPIPAFAPAIGPSDDDAPMIVREEVDHKAAQVASAPFIRSSDDDAPMIVREEVDHKAAQVASAPSIRSSDDDAPMIVREEEAEQVEQDREVNEEEEEDDDEKEDVDDHDDEAISDENEAVDLLDLTLAVPASAPLDWSHSLFYDRCRHSGSDTTSGSSRSAESSSSMEAWLDDSPMMTSKEMKKVQRYMQRTCGHKRSYK